MKYNNNQFPKIGGGLQKVGSTDLETDTLAKESKWYPFQTQPRMPRGALGTNPVNQGGERNIGFNVGGAPILFSAELKLFTGQNGTFNVGTLQSGFRNPYFVDEIRIAMLSDVFPIQGTYKELTGLSGAIKLRFAAGADTFSKVPISAGLFGTIKSPMDFGYVAVGEIGGVIQGRAFANVTFTLPKPLYIPAGGAITCDGFFADLSAFGFTGVGITTSLAYVGRALAPTLKQPVTRSVPWLAEIAKPFDARGTVVESSSEFRSPFQKDLHVQRFTMRAYETKIPGAFPLSPGGSFLEIGSLLSLSYDVQLSDSMGYSIAPNYTPIGSVFDSARHGWTFGRALGPLQQFNMKLRTSLTAPIPVAGDTSELRIGMVACREERV